MKKASKKSSFEQVSKRKDAVLHDKKILQDVIDTLNLTGNKFAKHLKYKASASVYHILEGRNNLSPEIIERIIKGFPAISYVFLTTGKGSPILTPAEQQAQKNLFRHLYPESVSQKNDPSKDISLLDNDISTEQMFKLMLISQNRTNQLIGELIDKIDKIQLNLARD